jgi:hypothetical protein
MMHHANSDEMKTEMTILLWNRAEFRSRNIIRSKDGHYVMIKETMPQEDTASLIAYPSNNKLSKYRI